MTAEQKVKFASGCWWIAFASKVAMLTASAFICVTDPRWWAFLSLGATLVALPCWAALRWLPGAWYSPRAMRARVGL